MWWWGSGWAKWWGAWCVYSARARWEQGGGWGTRQWGRDAGVTPSGRTFVHFGSESGVGLIVWLGDSRWGGNGGVQRLWWEETAVAVRHGRGARDGGLETLASRRSCHAWWPYVRVFGSRAGGLNRVVGVEAAGKVVAAVRCGGGGEIRGQGWWVWARATNVTGTGDGYGYGPIT